MSKVLVTTLIVIAVLALAGGLFFFGTLVGRSSLFQPAPAFGYNPASFGPGMRNRAGGYGMMGGRGGFGMMGGYAYANTTAAPLSVEQAKAAAQKYLAALNNDDLAVSEVMVFDNNAYVVVKEISTGIGAFELLVDPAALVAYPEYGPNMMWNVKYGGLNHSRMMGGYGGMMGGYGPRGSFAGGAPLSSNGADMTVRAAQAVQYAQKYLDASVPGALAADDPVEFYGYYTLDFSRDGRVAGMLSVNGYTGQVFLHTWHGTFVEEAE